MARQIEMHWVCSACHTRNLGRHKRCQQCGDPKDASEPWLMPSDTRRAPTINDPKLLRQATAGPDWQCGYCRSHQRRLDGRCAQCGAAEGEGKRVPRGGSTKSAQRWGGEKRKGLKRRVPIRRRARNPWRRTLAQSMRAIVLAIGAGTLLSCFATMAFAMIMMPDPVPPVLHKPKAVATTLASLSWTRVTHVERLEIVGQSGFIEDRPSDAFDIDSLGMAHHHDEQVFDHNRTEQYTEQVAYEELETYSEREQCGEDCNSLPESCHEVCTPNDNGFASCSESCTGGGQQCTPRYCSVTRTRNVTRYRTEFRTREVPVYRDEPRYAERFRWNAWRWQDNRDVTVSGDGTEEPHWAGGEELAPPAPLASGERERTSQSETFGATVEGDDGTFRVVVPNHAVYRTVSETESWWAVPLYGGTARLVKPITSFET